MNREEKIGDMRSKDWKEFIIFGLGGLVLFIVTSYAAMIDVLSFVNGERELYTYYSKTSGYNDLGIIFTIILIVLAVIGFAAFILETRSTYQKIRQLRNDEYTQK